MYIYVPDFASFLKFYKQGWGGEGEGACVVTLIHREGTVCHNYFKLILEKWFESVVAEKTSCLFSCYIPVCSHGPK